jgi:hypothetical protein
MVSFGNDSGGFCNRRVFLNQPNNYMMFRENSLGSNLKDFDLCTNTTQDKTLTKNPGNKSKWKL